MKKIFSIMAAAALACASLASCDKVNTDGADYKTLTITYGTDGNVLPTASADGAMITKAVVINQGGKYRDIDWTVSVDNDADWVTVSQTTVRTQYVGTYDGDDRVVIHKGVDIFVSPNETGEKRSAVIRFTVKDGSSIATVLNQSK
jgi:hypothetical protein